MTRVNTEIKFIREKSNYEPMPYGKYAGQPTVSLKLSSNVHNSMKVNSVESMWNSRNWKRKISSGYARLRLFGNDPFGEEHEESIEFLIDKIDPRFLDIEVEDRFLNKEPSTYIQRKTDTYTFFFDTTKGEIRYDPEVLEYVTENIANHGNAQYIFKVDSVTCEDRIKQFSRDYKVYDSDIWIFPKGRKRETMEDNLDSVVNIAKRNSWNVSPRMDLKIQTDDEESESD